MNSLFCLILSICSLLPILAMAANESSGTITMDFDLSAHHPGEEAELWVPYPISDRDQSISEIHVDGNFTESAVYSDSKFSTPILYARWDDMAASRHLSFSFHVVRQEVVRRDFPVPSEAPWNPIDFATYLEPTRFGPIDGEVKILADQITWGKTGVLDKAKAIYDWTCENTYRDPDTRGCGRGDVPALLKNPGGKCTDIHSIFVALCRAAGVPAREILGIRLGKKGEQDVSKWQHCWAEFYLPGYDWVPVDPADVRKMMLKHDLDLGDAGTREYRDYFWGGWDSRRVKLAVGRDVMLNPSQKGKPLNTFGYPYAEIGGDIIDWLDPENFKYSFTYRP